MTDVSVVGIDHIPELCKFAEANLNKTYSKEIEKGKIKIVCEDGRNGWDKEAPYDIVYVGGWNCSPLWQHVR